MIKKYEPIPNKKIVLPLKKLTIQYQFERMHQNATNLNEKGCSILHFTEATLH
jgi:hypothetical protein